jgi:hypothetical protein
MPAVLPLLRRLDVERVNPPCCSTPALRRSRKLEPLPPIESPVEMDLSRSGMRILPEMRSIRGSQAKPFGVGTHPNLCSIQHACAVLFPPLGCQLLPCCLCFCAKTYAVLSRPASPGIAVVHSHQLVVFDDGWGLALTSHTWSSIINQRPLFFWGINESKAYLLVINSSKLIHLAVPPSTPARLVTSSKPGTTAVHMAPISSVGHGCGLALTST